MPKKKFDPEGEGYDEETGARLNERAPLTIPKPTKYSGEYVIQPDANQAWVWHKDLNDYVKHSGSLDPDTGMVLKGRKHPTWDLMEKEETRRGNEIVKGKDGRYYSKKKSKFSVYDDQQKKGPGE